MQEIKSSAADSDLKPSASVQAVVVSSRPIKTKSKRRENQYEVAVMVKGGVIHTVQTHTGVPYWANDLVTFTVKEIAAGKPVLEQESVSPVQGALVSIENNTGYIRALVGGTGGDKAGFNRASQALRQPGSSFKPVLYSVALEWGKYDPRTIIVDEPIAVDMGSGQPEWIPENPDGRYQGPISLKDALVNSRNIPAIKTRMDLGPEALGQMARNMGITSPIRDSLSSALGASEVNLLELTSAYSVFPNLGVKVTPVLITKITDQAGNVLEDNTVTPLNPTERGRRDTRDKVCVAPPKSLEAKPDRTELPEGFTREPKSDCRVFEPDRPNMVRVISPQTAYLMLSMLREVTISGTGSSVRKMGRPDVGGKTGSTNDYSDAWFIGFNPKYHYGSLDRQRYTDYAGRKGIWRKSRTSCLGRIYVIRFAQ